MSKVLVTGVTGQDGAFIAKKLLSEGHQVFGTTRRSSSPKTDRLIALDILDDLELISLEITEFANVQSVLDEVCPDRIYNLAADSFVDDSHKHPQYTALVNYTGVLNFLEAIRILKLDSRLFQASTSDMFGYVQSSPQSEETPFNPINPYSISKLAAHHIVRSYRESYGMHVVNGIMYNHESELRGRQFVTRKISSWLAKIRAGYEIPIPLGNFDAARDWGYAPEFVDAMVMILEADEPSDFVIATNTRTTVREFLRWCCESAGFDVEFDGVGADEVCIDRKSGRKIAEVDQKYYRAVDVQILQGDATRLRESHGWTPRTSARELADIMTKYDIEILNGRK
jgi:GDPmannose 4,6-dehydratase